MAANSELTRRQAEEDICWDELNGESSWNWLCDWLIDRGYSLPQENDSPQQTILGEINQAWKEYNANPYPYPYPDHR